MVVSIVQVFYIILNIIHTFIHNRMKLSEKSFFRRITDFFLLLARQCMHLLTQLQLQ